MPRHLQLLDLRGLRILTDLAVTDVIRHAQGLPAGGLLEIASTVEIPSLREAARAHGFALRSKQGDDDTFHTQLARQLPQILDLTDLPPPEPFEMVLRELSGSRDLGAQGGGPPRTPSSEALYALLPRDPVPLRQHLAERGLTFEIVERCDGRALLRVER